MPRRTTLELNGIRVEMVEHVLAALAGLRVDNCEVWVNAPEMPGCDGSAQAFVEAIDAAGIVEQRSPVRQIVVGAAGPRRRRRLLDRSPAAAQRRAVGLVRSGLSARNRPSAGRRSRSTSRPTRSAASWRLAARSFRKKRPRRCSRRASASASRRSDLLIFGPHGPIDNTLRFPDECVRHKLLDVVGDLALTGCEIIGHVVAHRCGHQLHAELAQQLLEQAENGEQWFEPAARTKMCLRMSRRKEATRVNLFHCQIMAAIRSTQR